MMTQILRILLASDLTERSRCALVRAVQLKRATASGLTLLHVIESGLTEGLAKSRRAAAIGTMEAHLSDLSAGKLRRVVFKVSVGNPVTAIVAEAESGNIDLVVLGEPGEHRLKGLFAGTTAERVIRYSGRPVLVPKVQSDRPYRRIVIAFDRSEAAQRALATALALAPVPSFTWSTPRSVPGKSVERRQSARKSFSATPPNKSRAARSTPTRGLPSRLARALPFRRSRARWRLLMPISLRWGRTAAAGCRRRCSEAWRGSCWPPARAMSWLPGLRAESRPWIVDRTGWSAASAATLS
jgi:nucleotide-binding universal stress UspA family protein